METFINNIALALCENYSSLENLRIITPGKRTSVYFNEAFTNIKRERKENVFMTPSYTTIDNFIRENSSLTVISQFESLTYLYESYLKYTSKSVENTESADNFDSFYFWGGIILRDFDLIDKYLVNPKGIYSFLYEQKIMDSDISFLTQEQQEVLKAFWKTFPQDPSLLSSEQEKFIKLWKELYNIYQDLNDSLKSKSVGYSGMLYREVATKCKSFDIVIDKDITYCFVGFNALSKSEKDIFSYFRDNAKTLFFWDSDPIFESNEFEFHSAGLFQKENATMFTSKITPKTTKVFQSPKKIEILQYESNTAMCYDTNRILTNLKSTLNYIPNVKDRKLDKHTAIILIDEGLIKNLETSLDLQDLNANITMGLSLKDTPEYRDIIQLISVSTEETWQELHASISKRIIKDIDTLLSLLTEEILEDNERIEVIKEDLDTPIMIAKEDLNTTHLKLESLLLIKKSLENVYNSFIKKDFLSKIKRATYISILKKEMSNIKIPLDGQRDKGVQIMGILESRGLDFENIIFLAMDDDNIPGKLSSDSFIPWNISVAFEMPTYKETEAMYCYYFNRLFFKSSNVFLCYSGSTTNQKTGIPSRFIEQLKYDNILKDKPLEINIVSSPKLSKIMPIEISKKQERVSNFIASLVTLDKHEGVNKRTLSPSAIFTYLNCPLQFYFKYIEELKLPKLEEETSDNATFGTIFHKVAEVMYREFFINKREITKEILSSDLFNNASLEQYYHIAITELCKKVDFNGEESVDKIYQQHLENPDLGGVILVKRSVLSYIANLIKRDMSQAPFRVIGLEYEIKQQISLQGSKFLTLKGSIDRIDEIAGIPTIIDYKTGTQPYKDLNSFKFSDIETLFSELKEQKKGSDPKHIFQTLLYGVAYNLKTESYPKLSLIYTRMLSSFLKGLIPNRNLQKEGSASGSENSFMQLDNTGIAIVKEILDTIITELIDLETPFTSLIDDKKCAYCDFKDICHKKEVNTTY